MAMKIDLSKIRFDTVGNSLSPDLSSRDLLLLLKIKDLFARSLPRMPKDYIARLVFDPNHQSLAVLYGDSDILLGSITYRPFFKSDFSEIAFCAVEGDYQIKGIGTIMMDGLKEKIKEQNMHNILTYADNNAVLYFRKQGFSASIGFDKTMYWNKIKHYDKALLMHCVIETCVDYTQIRQIIQLQRATILARAGRRTKASVTARLTALALMREQERRECQKREEKEHKKEESTEYCTSSPLLPVSLPQKPSPDQLKEIDDEKQRRDPMLHENSISLFDYYTLKQYEVPIATSVHSSTLKYL
ncbi:Histone acetyltransferase GCN5 like protein, partial [Aduncisulcus paluster]